MRSHHSRFSADLLGWHMARRVTALLAALLMANATLASTAWACKSALSGSATSNGRPAHVHDDSGSTEHHNCDQPASHRAPCDMPSGSHCCGAFTPCSLALGLAGDAVTVGMPLERDSRVTIPGLVAPKARVTAPDPPPPKA